MRSRRHGRRSRRSRRSYKLTGSLPVGVSDLEKFTDELGEFIGWWLGYGVEVRTLSMPESKPERGYAYIHLEFDNYGAIMEEKYLREGLIRAIERILSAMELGDYLGYSTLSLDSGSLELLLYQKDR